MNPWEDLATLWEADPELTDEQVEQLIDAGDSRGLMREVAKRSLLGRGLPTALDAWLVDTMLAGSNGDSLDDLLGHRRARGEKQVTEEQLRREFFIACGVELAYRQPDTSIEAATHTVGEDVGLSARQVDRIYRKWRQLAERHVTAELERLGYDMK